jgi:hypothetical protein
MALLGQAPNRTNGIGRLGVHPGTRTFALRGRGNPGSNAFSHGVSVRVGKSGAQGQRPMGGSRGY